MGFAAFGLLSSLLAFVWLPLTARGPLSAQRSIHRWARFYLKLVDRMRIVGVRVEGAEQLASRRPRVIVANHPSLIDAVVLCGVLEQVDCVVKPSWARSLFLRGLVRSADWVSSESPRQLVEDCAARLRAGRTLLVFPEGTRSPRGGLGPFHRGAALTALRTGAPLLPVLIEFDYGITGKGQKWYDLGSRPVQVTLRIREEIASRPFADSGLPMAQASRKLNAELREAFLKGLDLVDGEA